MQISLGVDDALRQQIGEEDVDERRLYIAQRSAQLKCRSHLPLQVEFRLLRCHSEPIDGQTIRKVNARRLDQMKFLSAVIAKSAGQRHLAGIEIQIAAGVEPRRATL